MKTQDLQQQIIDYLNELTKSISKTDAELNAYYEIVEIISEHYSKKYKIMACNKDKYVFAFSESQLLYKKYYGIDIYAPRIDVGVTPTVLMNGRKVPIGVLLTSRADGSNKSEWQEYLENFYDHSAVWDILKNMFGYDDSSNDNKNPVYILGIEIESSGSVKYLMGDFMNATILSKIGIVVSNDRAVEKVKMLTKYIAQIEENRKLNNKQASFFIHPKKAFTSDEILEILSANETIGLKQCT